MYHYHQEGSSSWIDGTDDIQVTSRPDALLASGGAFLSLAHRRRQQQQQQPRVVRYTAEERRERIDKYRSKRNQRNFQKKITYACRKTLADSRPRVKGRFARNDGGSEYYAADQVVRAAAGISESESPPVTADVVAGNGSDDSTSMPEWWPAMEEALATGVDLCDEDMLAAYLGVSSISLYSPSYSPSASSYRDQ